MAYLLQPTPSTSAPPLTTAAARPHSGMRRPGCRSPRPVQFNFYPLGHSNSWGHSTATPLRGPKNFLALHTRARSTHPLLVARWRAVLPSIDSIGSPGRRSVFIDEMTKQPNDAMSNSDISTNGASTLNPCGADCVVLVCDIKTVRVQVPDPPSAQERNTLFWKLGPHFFAASPPWSR
jgi:hypothetical protein